MLRDKQGLFGLAVAGIAASIGVAACASGAGAPTTPNDKVTAETADITPQTLSDEEGACSQAPSPPLALPSFQLGGEFEIPYIGKSNFSAQFSDTADPAEGCKTSLKIGMDVEMKKIPPIIIFGVPVKLKSVGGDLTYGCEWKSVCKTPPKAECDTATQCCSLALAGHVTVSAGWSIPPTKLSGVFLFSANADIDATFELSGSVKFRTSTNEECQGGCATGKLSLNPSVGATFQACNSVIKKVAGCQKNTCRGDDGKFISGCCNCTRFTPSVSGSIGLLGSVSEQLCGPPAKFIGPKWCGCAVFKIPQIKISKYSFGGSDINLCSPKGCSD